MLKRTKEIARAAGEAVGVLVPSVADASKAAEDHRQALIAAQATLEKAEEDLQAGHDRGASDQEITRLEAARAAAKVEVSRAEARYIGAEKRLTAAHAAEAEKGKAAAIVKRDATLAARTKAAARIDSLAAELAAEAKTYDALLDVLNLAAAAGVATGYGRRSARVLIEAALRRAGVLPATGDPEQRPTAAQLTAQDNDAVTAGLPSERRGSNE